MMRALLAHFRIRALTIRRNVLHQGSFVGNIGSSSVGFASFIESCRCGFEAFNCIASGLFHQNDRLEATENLDIANKLENVEFVCSALSQSDAVLIDDDTRR